MAVLVTGGAGYIGSHFVLALCDRDEDVVVLDNLSTGHDWAVPKSVPLVLGDAGDEALVRSVTQQFDINAIAHFAGSTVVPESIRNPLGYYQNNTVVSHSLVSAAVDVGVRNFIFSSSAAVYGAPGREPVREDTIPSPISPYGRSKLMTETMLHDSAVAHDFRYASLRYFNVAGADPKGRSGQSAEIATHLVKAAVQVALGNRPAIDIYGTDYETPDGTCIRDYIHVTDLAEAHISALERLRAGGDSVVLNCGYGHGFSVRQVIAAVSKVSGANVTAREASRRPGDPPILIADASAIRTNLGWLPAHADLDEIARSALDWERDLYRRIRA